MKLTIKVERMENKVGKRVIDGKGMEGANKSQGRLASIMSSLGGL